MYMRWMAGVAMGCAVMAGCGAEVSQQSGPAPQISVQEVEDHSGGPPLSAEDEALVALQRLCPVTDEELGSHDMGAPVKLIVKGETVFICCKGCEKKVRSDEDAILVKVAQLKKESAKPNGEEGTTKE